MYAMNAARHSMYPRVKSLGMSSVKTLCCFTSENVIVQQLPTPFLCFAKFRAITQSKELLQPWALGPTTASVFQATILDE
jgi:hypothetical protein